MEKSSVQPVLPSIKCLSGGTTEVVRKMETLDKTELLKTLLLDSHMRILECTNNIPALVVARKTCYNDILDISSTPVLEISRETCFVDIPVEDCLERSDNLEELLNRHIWECESLTYLREKISSLICLHLQNEVKNLTESNIAYERDLEELLATSNYRQAEYEANQIKIKKMESFVSKLRKRNEEQRLWFENFRQKSLLREHSDKRKISELKKIIRDLEADFAKAKEIFTAIEHRLSVIKEKPWRELESEYKAVRRMATELNVKTANEYSANAATSRKARVPRKKRSNEVIRTNDRSSSLPRIKCRRKNS